jgi:hypothetical protein
MRTIQQKKAEHTLNKVLRYPEGIMSRRDWLNLQRVRGAFVKEETTARVQFSRTRYNRLTGQAQDEYYQKTLQKRPCFNLYFDNRTFIEITKAEFEYFQNMQISEDIQTQKHEIRHKIEAGVATEQEEQEYMQDDFNFFAKYA